MAVNNSSLSLVERRGAVQLCGEAIYLADVRGTKRRLHFSTAQDARSVAPQGLERKKGQTRPLVEAVGNPPHH